MKVTTIGTGAMYTKYNSACYLVDDDIIIDMPNGACKYLYRIDVNPNNINYILITHFHGDHYFDVPFCIQNKAKNDYKEIKIYSSKDGKLKIKNLGNLAFGKSYNKILDLIKVKYNFNNNFKIKDYKIEKILVTHDKLSTCYGYIFEYKDKFIGFTGDSALCNEIENMCEKCNYIFCDCSLIEGSIKHMGIDNITYLANKYPKCKFVTSHMRDNTREELKKLNIKNIIVPIDGKVINI